MPLPAVAPTRPQMPTQEDQERSVHSSTRLQILSDDWDDVINLWLREHIGEERLAAWGIPDTSANPLADLARQLSSLYDRQPDVLHSDPCARSLTGPGGFLDRAGLWTKLQQVQFLTLGMGDYLIRLDAPPGIDGLTVRPVSPHNVYAVANSAQPDVPVQIWELRLRWWEERKKQVFAWDVLDLGQTRVVDGETVVVREPSYRVVEAGRDGKHGDDLSNVFLGRLGGLVGDAYPYKYADGRAFLPYVFYRSVDTGKLWNHLEKRGVHRGTLNTALLWTYALHCARDATGSYVIVAGLEPIGEIVRDSAALTSGYGAGATSNLGVRSITITPGAVGYHRFTDDENRQPFVKDIGPGANLPEVFKAAVEYEIRQGVRFGLNPSDVSRAHANPMSAAALVVSQQGKREFSAKVEPIFRRADLETVRKAAALLNRAGACEHPLPEDGYSIVYKELPRSPQEEADRRDQLDWEVDKGQLSEIQRYMETHPGTSEDDALIALVKVQADRMMLQRRTEAMGAEMAKPAAPPAGMEPAEPEHEEDHPTGEAPKPPAGPR